MTTIDPSALLCYEILCSFQPEVSSYQLSALESACSTDESSIEVCPSFIVGAAFGATRRSAAPAPSNEEAALPSGLVASAGHPSQYAAVYAVGGVLRACKLLSADEAALSRALASYELPHTAEDEPPSVPEALVPEPAPAPAGVDADEEVWAAEPDGDDDVYEPLEPATRAMAAAAVTTTPQRAPSREEALRRLGHLLASLSHDPLAALPPGAWSRLGLGDGVRLALSRLTANSSSSSSSSPSAAAATKPNGVHGNGIASAVLLDASAHEAAIGSLSTILRDRLLHEPACLPIELTPTLAALEPPRRVRFLAALVAADTSISSTAGGTRRGSGNGDGGGSGRAVQPPLPPAAWSAVDAAVREQLIPLLASISDLESCLTGGAAAAPIGGGVTTSSRSSSNPAAADAKRVANAQLTCALQLLEWYLDPPLAQRANAGRLLLGTGAPQLLIRTVLQQPSSSVLRANGCWEWLLSACCRVHYSDVLSFAAAVPAFRAAVRAAAELNLPQARAGGDVGAATRGTRRQHRSRQQEATAGRTAGGGDRWRPGDSSRWIWWSIRRRRQLWHPQRDPRAHLAPSHRIGRPAAAARAQRAWGAHHEGARGLPLAGARRSGGGDCHKRPPRQR